MTAEDLQSILALDSYERYEYFLDAVAATEEIWFAQDQEGHVISVGDAPDEVDDDGEEGPVYMPLWPTRELAAVFIEDAEESLSLEKINVYEFLENWIPGLHEDGLKAGLLPNLDVTVWLMEPFELQEDLVEELGGEDDA